MNTRDIAKRVLGSRTGRVVVALLLLGYIGLLIASWRVQASRALDRIPPEDRGAVVLPAYTADGVVEGEAAAVAYETTTPAEVDPDRPWVVLLHGSPGAGSNMSMIADRLADAGYRVLAPDLPGFGASDSWIPDYSIKAHARYTLALMDELNIERAHVVGWSMGGGVAIWMAELARETDPDRIASVTILASIGTQETEGSGSYWFEHAKYGLGLGVLVGGFEMIPHFGALGEVHNRHAFLRNFFDTDQRPLRGMMEHLDTPVLILHGRRDFLVAPWAAEYHHEVTPASSLAMLDMTHFVAFVPEELDLAIPQLRAFFERHDEPGVAPLAQTLDLSGYKPPTGFAGVLHWIESHVRWWPWWVQLGVLALLAR